MEKTMKTEERKTPVKTTRLPELIAICDDSDEPRYDYSDGYFDEQLNYHFHEYSPWHSVLYPWEWTVWPEIVQYAESLGIQIPANPSIDLSKTF